jgi:hypothetical protein
MPRTSRTRRNPNDRGGVTVEAAVALASFLIVLSLSIGGLLAAADQVRCVDAAREAARLTARGDPEQAKSAAARIAPPNAKITIRTEGEHIEVDIHATPANDLLPGLALHAEAFAVREPTAPE